MLLKLPVTQRKRFLDQIVEVDRSSVLDVTLEVGSDGLDQRSRAQAVAKSWRLSFPGY